MSEFKEKQKMIVGFLDRNFQTNLTKTYEIDTESAFYRAVIEKLAIRLRQYIERDVDKLFQVLYQIDVKDYLVDQAFDLGEVQKVSERLAELILEREIQKLKYQAQHKNDLKSK